MTSHLKQRLIDTWALGKHTNITDIINKAVVQWTKRLCESMKANDVTLDICKLKPALLTANTLHNQLFSEPPIVYQGKHVVSRHFRRSYLKANKVSKSDGTRTVEHAYNF